MRGDKRIPEKEITVLSELLMVQLLKLDSIEADGETKTQRRIENLTLDPHREKPENRATDETTKEELFEKHQKLKLGLSLFQKEETEHMVIYLSYTFGDSLCNCGNFDVEAGNSW